MALRACRFCADVVVEEARVGVGVGVGVGVLVVGVLVVGVDELAAPLAVLLRPPLHGVNAMRMFGTLRSGRL